MKLYREWCLQPNHRKGVMLPLRRFETIVKGKDSGYASVYMFDEESARVILGAKSSVGLDRFPVYTDTLVIDLDKGDEQLKVVAEKLALENLGFELWSSGGKGYHVIIPLKRMVSGRNVPYSQRKWVEKLDVGADLSLYQHGRILSLPGRVHPKTGKKKQLVKRVKGKPLDLPLLEMPEPMFKLGEVRDAAGQLEAGLWAVLALIENPPEPGNRHTKLWSTALYLRDAGLAMETTLDLLLTVNGEWEEAKTDDEVQAAIEQAYKR